MNSYFSAGDWAVIATYLLGIIGLGLWFGKDQHNTRDYFLGSKTVPWWCTGLSIVAAETSSLCLFDRACRTQLCENWGSCCP